MNEKALIRKSQRGEKDAFEQLIRLYYPYVSGFLLRMTGDINTSQDLTQDTFLKMIRNIDRFELNGKANFGTWIITIAKNCYIDYLRRNRSYINYIDIDFLQMDSGVDIFKDVSIKLQYEDLIRDMDKLPPEQRIAIKLKYEEGLTLEEIAKQFSVSSKTIKSRIHEGTVKLRKKLIF